MMFPDQHRAIGRELGFPSCCVDQWIADVQQGIPAASVRGSVTERTRPPLEALALSVAASSILGQAWPSGGGAILSADALNKKYVPCDACANRHGTRGGHNVVIARETLDKRPQRP